MSVQLCLFFFFSSRRRHTRSLCDWSSDVCSSDLRLRTRTGRWGKLLPRHGRPMDSKALQDSPDVGVAVVAADWTIVEWNDAAARITGLPADRVLGKTFWIAFPTARATQAERVLQDVLIDGQPRSYLAPAHAPEFKGTFFE